MEITLTVKCYLAFLITPFLSISQKIEGTVFSYDNKQPLSFCTIGIEGKDIGTVSDINGYFQLQIGDTLIGDSLTFSYVGFNDLKVALTTLISKKNNNVFLKEKIKVLDEVLVLAKRGKQVDFGYKKNTETFLWLKGTGEGAEIATRLPLKKSIYLDGVSLQIENKEGNEFLLLLNIYEVDQNTKLPGKQLLKKRKLIKSNQKDGWLTVDISDQNLRLDKPFYVGFKWVDNDTRTPLLGINFKPEKSYIRVISLGKWNEYLNVNIKAKGTVAKADN